MVTKKKASAATVKECSLVAVKPVKHEVGGKKYSFPKDKPIGSDTPANIISHLKRVGVVKDLKEAEDAE